MRLNNKILGRRYKVVKKLAEGGFGETFVAKDMHLPGNPKCVVKKLKPQYADPGTWQTARRLFDSEAKVLYQLGEHDQIPRLLAHFEENKEFYLAQELIEGEPLNQELVSGQPWSEVKVVAFLQDLLSVVSFVHQQRVIHRDIKPENLIRRRKDNKIVLIDFGAVKQLSTRTTKAKAASTKLTIPIGTPNYAPREQWAGRPCLSSDVYAVGIIGIQALTGIPPHYLTYDPKSGEINWHDYISNSVNRQLVDILDRMTRSEFRSRYSTATQALEALRKLPAKLLESGSSDRILNRKNADSNLSIVDTVGIYKFLTSQSLSAGANLISKISTVALGEKSRSLAKLLNIEVWKERIQWDSLTQKQKLIGASAIGLSLLSAIIVLNIKSDPKVKKSAEFLKTAEKARQNGNYAEALSAYNRAIETKPDLSEAHLGSCNALTSLKEYDRALAACNRALALKPKYPEALFGKGLVLEKQHKYSEAAGVYKQAVEIDSKYTEAWNHLGLALLSLRNKQKAPEAIDAFNRAIELQQDLAEAYWGRCSSLNLLEQYRKAIEECDRAIAIRPKYEEALLDKGFALERENKFADALKLYTQIIEINPQSSKAWNSLGFARLALKENQSALEAFDKALAIRPDYPEALVSKGIALDRLGSHRRAFQAYDRAIKLDAKYAQAWYFKGRHLMLYHRRPQETLDAFERTVALDPEFARAWVDRGVALLNLRRFDEAIASIQKGLKLEPNNESAKNLLDRTLQNSGRN